MPRRSPVAFLVALAAALPLIAHGRPARACGGGMFVSAGEEQTSQVAAHAVVVSISKKQTVLWDRITYTGSPSGFAWVMPVGSGARLELASATFIEAMIGGTNPVIRGPELMCDSGDSGSSGGCSCLGGAMAGGVDRGNYGAPDSEQVTVVHAETIGPYETVTIKSETPGAIGDWLTQNGYAIPAAVKPALDDYAAKGMEFLAAKLKPGAGVQDMKPVRVVMPGALTTFPMRMLAAGAAGTVPVQMLVVSEGGYQAQGYGNAVVDEAQLSWDFAAGASNYRALRSAALAADGGATFLTSLRIGGGLLGGLTTPSSNPDRTESFSLGPDVQFSTLGALFFNRLLQNGEVTQACAVDPVASVASSSDEVVELCEDPAAPCSSLQAGQLDAQTFACGEVDDLGVALVGLHPKDITLTRLEAELPVSSLTQDLTLAPATGAEVFHDLYAAKAENAPCDEVMASIDARRHRSPTRAPLSAGAFALAAALAFARKQSRKR